MKNNRALTPEQQKLVEENHDLIFGVLRDMGLDDDFYDIAAIGLCKAALRFKNPNKVRFSTFAYHIIQNEIINEFDYRNAKKRTGTTVSMNAPLIADSELTLGAMLYHPDTPEIIAFAKDLMTALDGLTKRQQKAMRLSIQGYTYPEIGKLIGGTPKAVSMLLTSARKTLRTSGYA